MHLPLADATQCAVHLRRTVSLLARRLRPNLHGDDISVAKLSVLGQVYRAGSITPTALAVQEGVKIQSLTRLLSELESDGWLVRRRHASDGRQSILTLTQEGASHLEAAVQVGEASLSRIIATTLSAEQCAILLQASILLEGIADALGSSTPVAQATVIRRRGDY